MRKGIYILPNSLTLCGMFAGFLSMMATLKGNYPLAAWAIIIAALFDGLDGWVARITQSTTKFGIELDSLSDVIAFGVAPAVLLYDWSLSSYGRIGAAVAFLFVGCGALRLARYNVQMGSAERKVFTGMPIPAAAGIAATTVLLYSRYGIDPHRSLYILLLTLIAALLMVSRMPYHSHKEMSPTKRKPFRILVGVVVFIAVFITYPELTLFVMGVLYLLSGVFESVFGFLRKPRTI